MTNRVLITGIAGQTGSHLADYILENHPNWEVHGTIRYRSDTTNIDHCLNSLRLHECELRDAHNVYRIIEKIKPDRVFHLAATSFVRASWDQPADIINNNVNSQINLFEALIRFAPKTKVQVACFPAGTRVQTPFGYSKIEEINIGDYLISHNGEANLISDKSCVPYQGKMVNIHVMGCKKFNATSNHPILVFKREDITYPSGRRRPRHQWPKPKWVPAGEISSGDYIAIVQSKDPGDQQELDLSTLVDHGVISEDRIYPPCYLNDQIIPNSNSNGLPVIVKLDYNFGYLCGAYLAEGSQSGKNKAIRLHIHQDELNEGLGEKSISMMSALGLNPTHYRDRDSKGATIFVGSSLLAEIFYKLFKSGSKTKKIDPQVFSWNRECIKGLLKGYLDGDGAQPNRNRHAETLICSSVNEQLIDQLFILGNQIGLNPGRAGPYRSNEESFGFSDYWEIKFSQNWAPELFKEEITPKQYYEINYESQFFRRVLNIKTKEYKGNVYNFTVENDHSYVVEGCCVHNCSSEQFGEVFEHEVPITEKNDLRPISPYAVSKCAQENIAFQYHRSYGLHTIITRTFNHTGPRRGDAFVESSFSKQVAMIETGLQEPLILHGNLESVRDYTDARDIAEAYWVAVDKCQPGEPYNICSSMRISIGDLLQLFIKLSTYDGKIETRVDPIRLRPSDVVLLYGNSDKFQAQTSWSPKYDLEHTMGDLLKAWRRKIAIMKSFKS